MFKANAPPQPNRCIIFTTTQNTPPDKKTPGNISFQSSKSEAGMQFLPLDCTAKAPPNLTVALFSGEGSALLTNNNH